MIYKVNDNYTDSTNFFFIGEIFEGEMEKSWIVSLSKTGKFKGTRAIIKHEDVTEIAETWEEAKEEYPEVFL